MFVSRMGMLLLVTLVSWGSMASLHPALAAEDSDELTPEFFALPETDKASDLLAFIQKIQDREPTSREEQLILIQNAGKAIRRAARRIQELETNEKSPLWLMANTILLLQDARRLGAAPLEERTALLDKVKEHVGNSEKTVNEARLAAFSVMNLEDDARDLAAKAYQEFSEVFKASKDEDVQRIGTIFAGSARRMHLLGNEMEVKGKTVKGHPFDVKNLKGKIVLVDFWATWCGPCMQEYPRVRKLYDKYHSKGFEIVGINKDKERSKLESFLRDQKTPWPNLFEDNVDGQHPVAVHYGVNALPTMIVIDREGKVVKLQSNSQDLERYLEKELGPVDE